MKTIYKILFERAIVVLQKGTIVTVCIVMTVLLILSISFSSCRKDKEEMEEILLEYVKCPCEHETNKQQTFNTISNVLIFDTSKFTQKQTENFEGFPSEQPYILFDPVTGNAVLLTNYGPQWIWNGVICNFPVQFNWKIPVDGMRISITYEVFEKCEPMGFIPEHFYFDVVLTSLKIQTK
jgi:hypothetical protein